MSVVESAGKWKSVISKSDFILIDLTTFTNYTNNKKRQQQQKKQSSKFIDERGALWTQIPTGLFLDKK